MRSRRRRAASGGSPALYLPGIAGNYASTPDSVAVSVTGDIDLRVCAALPDWSPVSTITLVGKIDSTTTRSYWFNADGTVLRLSFSTTGSNTVTVDSTAHGIMDGTVQWVRVTRVAATGVCTFYKSEDGETWTQISQPTGTSGNLFDSTSAVEIGSVFGGTAQLATGKVYRAQIFDGIDGTLVADFDPSDTHPGDTSFVSAATGETWTINQSGTNPARIVPR